MDKKLDVLVQFGRRVREMRKAKGFSQETFAARCGLDRPYIGGIERGEWNVALRNIERIAQALDVTISELMQGEVVEICVPDQWLAYQTLLAQMDRIYYFDIPYRYQILTAQYPELIAIKSFGTFFVKTEMEAVLYS
jgi:transcriptional regulator with XRE-family HTH domain